MQNFCKSDKFKGVISFEKRENCVVCGNKLGEPLIRLPNFPLTEIYVDKKVSEGLGFVDQEFHFCENCGHGQIANLINPKILYGENYFTRTSTSKSASNAIDIFLDFVNSVKGGNNFKTIIDIGCNDLYTLKKLESKAEKLYGIDPILKGKEEQFNNEKIKVIGDFVENVDFDKLNIKMDIVLCSHTLEHIENPKKLIQSLMKNATSETIFFFQFPGLESLIQNSKFDQIFHQHLNYFSLKSVIYMMEILGGELIDFKINPDHWGALMIAFKKKNQNNPVSNEKFQKFIIPITTEKILQKYKIFKDCMEIANECLVSMKNEKIYGYGAALMFPILNYYMKGLSELEYIIDEDKNKQGLYYINSSPKIIALKEVEDIKNSTIIITAINSKQVLRAITSKLIDLKIKNILIPINLI